MTEIWFYHLQSQPLERALPAIVEKALRRPWRVVIQTVDDLRLKALDDLLWTWAPESFLPHALSREATGTSPILLTTDRDDPDGAALRMYVDGAEIDLDPTTTTYERVIFMFDGRNEAEVEAARRQWSRLKTQGFPLAYWQQTPEGRWDRRS